MKYVFVVAASLAAIAAAGPASAKDKACNGESMAKAYKTVSSMADTPVKYAAYKDLGMANAAWSKGDMRTACKHMMKVSKMSSSKM